MFRIQISGEKQHIISFILNEISTKNDMFMNLLCYHAGIEIRNKEGFIFNNIRGISIDKQLISAKAVIENFSPLFILPLQLSSNAIYQYSQLQQLTDKYNLHLAYS